MAITELQALEEHRYFYFGFESHPTEDNPWQATPVTAYSDNLVQWETIAHHPELGSLRDGYVKKIGDVYYIIGTDDFYKTTDWISFKKLPWLNGVSQYRNVWAPELFQDIDGNWHIVFCAGSNLDGDFSVYVTDFDPATDSIGTTNSPIQIRTDDDVNTWRIDPDITLIDGVYYLVLAGNYVFSSPNYLGPYQKFPANFAATPQKYGRNYSNLANWSEGPDMFVDGDSVRLFADQTASGLVFRSATKDNLFDWSDVAKTHAHFAMRHGSILVNEKVSAKTDEDLSDLPKFDTQMTIQGVQADSPVALTCYMKNSFEYQYEDNQTNQIQFVAYDDGSPSFAYIANESTVMFNNDLFIIKNIEEDDEGIGLYTVTMMQYVNSEIGRVRQRNMRSGVLTYSVQDVLDYFLNDKVANPFGFTYQVFGDFDKQQIENLGACSGKDMISKIIETWPGTIIYPHWKTLNVFAPGSFAKNYQRRIVYKYNSSDMKLTEDSTGIVNQVLAIGATKEEDTDNESADNSSLSITHPVETITTGVDNTSTFQADAKKYLGVPYVWGGHNKANPWAGMDCSGYVSQVYHDFGIEIPAYTVSMESDFYTIPRSQVKAGDVGFYGSHGSSYHIALMLDNSTMIYEPEPGQSCKTAPIDSYSPSWFGRNDQMQAKINTKKTETVEGEHITYHDDYSASQVSTTAEYYFQPFIVQDNHSIQQWGLHPGEDVQDDRFKDPNEMAAYALKQLNTDPTISVEVVMHTNIQPIPGEQAYLTIPERGTLATGSSSTTQSAYNTTVTAVGFTWYPFDPAQGTDITFDNLQASILHANTTSYINSRLEKLANQMFDRMPEIYYSKSDPSATQQVSNGAIWVRPVEDDVTNDEEKGSDSNGK